MTKLSLQHIHQPFQSVAVNGDDIETASRLGLLALQKELGDPCHAGLLGGRHAGGRAAELPAAALSDFDKDQSSAVLHDEVDFPALAQEVARHQAQAVLLQMGQRWSSAAWP